ncbi:hypothetical protein NB646_05330 [Oxalobacter aliiformigenes]|uniref:Uncharacterized protein n=1 Tax=Oxalobacter aliiformigenes TaxID=2946593 RepID=A0A9E9NSJ0_9BURK|nr:hypothetical protein [Oxalobacter aliiformigenes]WAV90299.1 hypothetical protein NB646_05330 [Oxalobacter aliiformigenes]
MMFHVQCGIRTGCRKCDLNSSMRRREVSGIPDISGWYGLPVAGWYAAEIRQMENAGKKCLPEKQRG